MFTRLRGRMAVTLVSLSAMGSVIGMVAFSTAPAAAAHASRCRVAAPHHKTPHKDLDRDSCDRHGLDDGDGATV